MRKIFVLTSVVLLSGVAIWWTRQRVVHADPTPPSASIPAPTAPIDAIQYGYKPSLVSQAPSEALTPLSRLPKTQQDVIVKEIEQEKLRAPSRDAMTSYSQGVLARAQHIEAVRTAGMEVNP